MQHPSVLQLQQTVSNQQALLVQQASLIQQLVQIIEANGIDVKKMQSDEQPLQFGDHQG
jgi:2-keto-3-deoxy-galactonokinase